MHTVNPHENGYDPAGFVWIQDENLCGEGHLSPRTTVCFGRMQRRSPLLDHPDVCRAKGCTGQLHENAFPEVVSRSMYDKDFHYRGFASAPKKPAYDTEVPLLVWYLDQLLVPIVAGEWTVTEAMKAKATYSDWPIGDYCDLYAICVPCGAQVSVMLPTGI